MTRNGQSTNDIERFGSEFTVIDIGVGTIEDRNPINRAVEVLVLWPMLIRVYGRKSCCSIRLQPSFISGLLNLSLKRRKNNAETHKCSF